MSAPDDVVVSTITGVFALISGRSANPHDGVLQEVEIATGG